MHAAPALYFIVLALTGPAMATPAETGARAAEPVIACASLANLRAVLRTTKDDQTAAVPIVTDPRSDLGCHPLDRNLVTEVVEHVALHGRAYECLGLKNTRICQWTIAGAVQPRGEDKPEKPATRGGQSKPRR